MGHIHFGEDEELADAAQPLAIAGHMAAPSLPQCCDVARVSANRGNPSYVFKAICNESRDAAVASTSDNIVKAFSIASARLAHVRDFTGHTKTITDVQFADASIFLSCSHDGSVRGWDLRSGLQAESYTTTQELYSCSVLEHLLAAGGQGEVCFWDRRSPAQPVAKLSDTHMDEVTQVKIHPSQHVISASTDGLVAVHNMSAGVADEDDNFTAALNVGTSVEEVGLYGQEGERLWVRTGTESLHLWEWRVATLCDKEGGHGAFAEWPEARSTAAQAAATSSVSSLFEEVGYLVGCHYDKPSRSLMLMAGNEGTVGFFPLIEQAGGDGVSLVGAMMQPPVMALQGAHSDVVRSVQCFGSSTQGPFCVSGGEDGQVCLWSLSSSSVSAAAAGAAGQGVLVGHGRPPANQAAAHGPTEMDCDGAGPANRKQGGKQGGWGKQVRKQSPY